MTPEEQAEMERLLAAYERMMANGGDPGLAAGLRPFGDNDPNTNTFQDRVQMLGDPLTSAMSGPGAFDYDAFMPTIERTPVDNIGWLKAQQWANAPIGSATRTIYDLVVADQMDVGTAIQTVRAEVEADTEGVTDLTKSLPLDTANQYGEINVGSGLRKLEEQAYEMAGGLAAAPAGAIPDGMGGYYTETETPSALAEQFRDKYALPLPTERYEQDPSIIMDAMEREGSGYMPGMEGFAPGMVSRSAALNSDLTSIGASEAAIRQQIAEMAIGPQGASASGDTADAENVNRGGGGIEMMPPGARGDWTVRTPGTPATRNEQGVPQGGTPLGSRTIEGDAFNPQGAPSSGGGGGFNPLEIPGWIGDKLGRLNDAPESSGGGGNPFEVLGRLGGGNSGQQSGGGERGAGGSWYDPESIATRRMKALSETLSNQETQRRSAQKAINQDVRDRRKARVAGDPGSRDAITQARYAAANGGPLRLNPGQSFLTGEDAVAGRRAYLDQRATTPFMDAMRDRMLMQQGSGF